MLSVIISTYNCAEQVSACIGSVLRQEAAGTIEILVVDNASRDLTPGLLKSRYPGVRLIENSRNLGACHARNQGIAASRGEWVLVLDCDTLLEDGFIREAMAHIRGLPDNAGIVQPKIMQADGKTIYSTGIFVSRILRRFYDIGKGAADGKRGAAEKPLIGACAAAAFLRRSMLEDVREETGYFDERFFFLVEDVDLACRARLKGWKASYCPAAVCRHRGASSGFDRALRQYLCWRNRKMMLAKLPCGLLERLVRSAWYELPRAGALLVSNPYVRRQMIYQRDPVSML